MCTPLVLTSRHETVKLKNNDVVSFLDGSNEEPVKTACCIEPTCDSICAERCESLKNKLGLVACNTVTSGEAVSPDCDCKIPCESFNAPSASDEIKFERKSGMVRLVDEADAISSTCFIREMKCVESICSEQNKVLKKSFVLTQSLNGEGGTRVHDIYYKEDMDKLETCCRDKSCALDVQCENPVFKSKATTSTIGDINNETCCDIHCPSFLTAYGEKACDGKQMFTNEDKTVSNVKDCCVDTTTCNEHTCKGTTFKIEDNDELTKDRPNDDTLQNACCIKGEQCPDDCSKKFTGFVNKEGREKVVAKDKIMVRYQSFLLAHYSLTH